MNGSFSNILYIIFTLLVNCGAPTDKSMLQETDSGNYLGQVERSEETKCDPNTWECQICTLINMNEFNYCNVCGNPKDAPNNIQYKTPSGNLNDPSKSKNRPINSHDMLLHKAVKEKQNLDTIKFILDAVDINELDGECKTALDHATKGTEIYNLLVDKGGYKNIDRQLSLSCENGEEKKVSEMISQGGDVKILDKEKNNLLHKSCRNGHLEVSKILIDECSELKNQVNLLDETPLKLAIMYGNNHSLNQYLVKEGGLLEPKETYIDQIQTLNNEKSELQKTIINLNQEKTMLVSQIETLEDPEKSEELYETPMKSISGHTHYVPSVRFSPDGQTIASGSGDKTIKLWRVSDGSLLRTLQGHTNTVWFVSYSLDGKIIASGSGDKTIKLWRVSDGSLLRTLQGHINTVFSVSFSPDGKTLASGSDDKTIKLWLVSDGSLIRTLQGHTNTVNSISFSPDGKTIASGSADKTIKLWSVSDGSLIRTLGGNTGRVNSVSFSPDGDTLASAGNARTIKLWSVSDGSLIKTVNIGFGHSSNLSFSLDLKIIASAGYDNTIELWSVSDGSLIRTLQGHTNRVWSVSYSPDGKTLASAGNARTIKLWRLKP